ncbi:MAG: hypothetical protein ACK5KM_05200 [Hyphomicrobiaceae bacterium]
MLTKEEKRIVAYYLATRVTLISSLLQFVPFLLPPIAFAAYGIWKQDILAITFAFAVLLVFAVWYLVSQYLSASHLLSALRKYEDAVRALDKPDLKSE